MRRSFWTPLLIGLAVVGGLLVLPSYFVKLDPLIVLRTTVLDWAMILGAVALVIGVLNLGRVHWSKIRTHQPGNGYSLVVLISLLITVVVMGIDGATGSWTMLIYEHVLLPIETSLMAILAIVLLFALGRMVYHRANPFTLIFAVFALFFMGSAFFVTGFRFPLITELRDWFVQSLAVAGTRGILLGVALGTIATGLRVLMGADRPYGG